MDRSNDPVRDEFVRRLGTLSSVRRSDVASDADADVATDAFRWLRNHSNRLDADDKRQLLESGLVETCSWFCDRYLSRSPLGRSVLMQFLANFSANDQNARLRIYQGFRHTLRHLILHVEDTKLLNNSIMLLYNLCLFNNHSRLEILKDVEIVQKIMVHWSENEIEYSKIFLDSVFSNSKDFLVLYKNLPDSSTTQLMDLLSVWLDHYQNDVAQEVINVIKNNFFMNYTVEKITRSVVNVLAKASAIDKFNLEIKKDTFLLKKLIDLLTVIHERGKNTDGSNDEFSHIKDLSALFVNSDLLTHDRYWFKSDIIRLIANMCYNHKEHQHLIRSNNVIPILLECCSFDAKNPLMREWSLFALRNILEGNLDNQNFVANIDSVGSTDCESSVMVSDPLGMTTIKNSTSNSDTMFI